jgi:hypothetical protein
MFSDSKATNQHSQNALGVPNRIPGGDERFPYKMYNILEGEEKCEDTDIITWTPDGSAFIISDTGRFEKEVIPLHFGNRILYRSFQRKLYRWGFQKLSINTGKQLLYSNKYFKKGFPGLLSQMHSKGRNYTTKLALQRPPQILIPRPLHRDIKPKPSNNEVDVASALLDMSGNSMRPRNSSFDSVQVNSLRPRISSFDAVQVNSLRPRISSFDSVQSDTRVDISLAPAVPTSSTSFYVRYPIKAQPPVFLTNVPMQFNGMQFSPSAQFFNQNQLQILRRNNEYRL